MQVATTKTSLDGSITPVSVDANSGKIARKKNNTSTGDELDYGSTSKQRSSSGGSFGDDNNTNKEFGSKIKDFLNLLINKNSFVGADVANVGSALLEGVINWGEKMSDVYTYTTNKQEIAQMRDAALVMSLFGYDYDIEPLIEMKEIGTAQGIAFDISDKLFDSLYSTEIGQKINNSAYDWFKRSLEGSNGFLYDTFKSVGEYAPILAGANYLEAATGVPKAVWQGGLASMAKFGGDLEKNYGIIFKKAEQDGTNVTLEQLTDAEVRASGAAIVDGAIVMASGLLKGVGDKKSKDLGNALNIAVKATKSFFNECLDTYVYKVDEHGLGFEGDPDGVVDEFDWSKVLIDAGGVVVAEAASLWFDGLFKKADFHSSSSSSSKVVSEVTPGSMPDLDTTEDALDVVIDWVGATLKIDKDIFKRIGKEGASDIFDIAVDFLDTVFSEGDSNG